MKTVNNIKNILLLVLIVCAGDASAQQFITRSKVALPDSIAQTRHEWSDLDNDGLLDILLLATSDTHNHYAMFIKGDTLNALQVLDKTIPLMTLDTYRLIDYNRDNQMDIIVSGTDGAASHTVVYQNKGNFEFDEITLTIPAFKTLRWADLDNDGNTEWIASGENNDGPYMHILRENTPGTWATVYDAFKIQTTALEVLDVNHDGTLDLFISGTAGPDSLFTGFLINHGDFSFSPANRQPWTGTAALSDFNADGYTDIIFTGHDGNNNKISKRFTGKEQNYTVGENPFILENGYLFAADLNSDGIPDFNYLGPTATDDTLNTITYGPRDYDTLTHRNLSTQRFGDLEHDGDLDLAQIVADTPILVRVLENQPTKKNKAPEKPLNAIALPVFNRQFLYWQKPLDDNTPTASITYDLFIYTDAAPRQVGEFDMLLDKRITVTPGNNGTSNFRLLKNITTPTIQFSVQAVDNALHAGTTCTGSGNASACATLKTERRSVCSGEALALTAPAQALWFSFSKGYLGMAQTINVQPITRDTVFYFEPQQLGCAALKAWIISIKNDTTKSITAAIYTCKDATLKLGVESGWQNIEWSSYYAGNLGSTDSIQYLVTRPDTVFVTVSSNLGCTILRKTGIALSTPVLTVEADAYRILKGQSAQLQAAGVRRYEWSPAEGLDHPDIAAPVASPSLTTTYTVTGYDSVNCSAKATVIVWVEAAGFVPTLFSPNDDGNNDRLKVYGLAAAGSFTFSVFSRDGSLVFKTNSVAEIAQSGWDGTTNGVRQPGGVYYWEVNGSLASGSSLLLNGKKSGFVVLIR